MVGRPQWPTRLTYVDLFAGPGVLSIEGARYPGSALLAAHTPKQFDRLIFCEIEEDLALALQSRLAETPCAAQSKVLKGDCNDLIHEVVTQIPRDSLTLAFVDPPGLEAAFSTVCVLGRDRNVDLLMLIPTEMNAHRNIQRYFFPDESSKLDAFLGPDSGWRDRYNGIANQTRPSVSKMIVEVYKEQLRKHLGYKVFGDEVIRFNNMPIYRILFASKHELGLHFWELATRRNRRGGTFSFE